MAVVAAEIGAIGKLTPRDGILEVTGNAGSMIDQILVKTYDKVSKGDILLVLSDKLMKAELDRARIEFDRASGTDDIDDFPTRYALHLFLVEFADELTALVQVSKGLPALTARNHL